MSAYSAADVVAVRVRPLREDAAGVWSWWCTDMLTRTVEAGGYGVDAGSAFEAARIFAGNIGRMLDGSVRMTGRSATYGLSA